jgi:hypothetical protein
MASTTSQVTSASVYGGQATDYTIGGPVSDNRKFGSGFVWSPAVWSPPLAPPGSTGTPCTTFGCTTLAQQMGNAVLVSVHPFLLLVCWFV